MAGNVIFRTLNRIHIFLYRKSGGKILGSVVGSPVLILTTTGRKTGKKRTVPLVHLRDGNNYVVIASDNPAWHRNLQANPQATIEIRGQSIPVTARNASDTESDSLWDKIVAQSPAFKSARGHSNHQLVILETH